MELAVAHGYLSATQQGYAETRRRAWSGEKPKGMVDMARDMARLSGATVHGASPDGPRA